jgi:hypothetical protein
MQGTVKRLKIKYKEFNLQRANLCTVNNHVLNIWTALRSLAEYLNFCYIPLALFFCYFFKVVFQNAEDYANMDLAGTKRRHRIVNKVVIG